MATQIYTVKEVQEGLADENIGWPYQDRIEQEYFFGGKVYEVQSSQGTLAEHEVLGEISGDTFSSTDATFEAKITATLRPVKALALQCSDGIVVIAQDLFFRQNGKRIEGYWYSERAPHFPMPIAGELSTIEAQQIFDLIKVKEAESSEIHTRGFSRSRIDDSIVGNSEFNHDKWLWPQGFAEHYVLKHKVRPSDAFLKFIGWEN